MANDSQAGGLREMYPELAEANTAVITELRDAKEELLRTYPLLKLIRGDSDYGFIDAGSLPSGSSRGNIIAGVDSITWAITDNFGGSYNHCGSVAITNLALIFSRKTPTSRYGNVLKEGSLFSTFWDIYSKFGPGPYVTIAEKATSYFASRGFALNSQGANSAGEIVTAINNQRPCGLLLCNGLVDWHWVICYGYRQYSNTGETYLRVANGWSTSYNKYYRIHVGSLFMGGSSYGIN